MSREESTESGLHCLSCDGQDVETLDDDRNRCLDCGAVFEVAPDGTPVYSRKVWLVTKVGLAILPGIAFALGAANLYLFQRPAYTVVFVGLGVLMLASSWNDIRRLGAYVA